MVFDRSRRVDGVLKYISSDTDSRRAKVQDGNFNLGWLTYETRTGVTLIQRYKEAGMRTRLRQALSTKELNTNMSESWVQMKMAYRNVQKAIAERRENRRMENERRAREKADRLSNSIMRKVRKPQKSKRWGGDGGPGKKKPP